MPKQNPQPLAKAGKLISFSLCSSVPSRLGG